MLLAVAAVATLLLLGAFWFLVACGPPLLLQHSCQWPVWPQPEHTESLVGHEDLPGAL